MMPSVIDFAKRVLSPDAVRGKSVIEVGSYDFNGSVREPIKRMGCASYLGVDMVAGPGVDEVCDATKVVSRFGDQSFDVVLSTEMLEHARHWRSTVNNLKRVVKPGGTLLVTTRSRGFPYHGYPSDYWRFELEDFRAIFSDFDIQALESDPLRPGVLLLAKRYAPPRDLPDLEKINVYSMLAHERIYDLSIKNHVAWQAEWFVRRVFGRLMPNIKEHFTEVA